MGKVVARIFFAVTGGLPLLLLAVVLLMVWVDPGSVPGRGWLRAAASLVMVEFLLLHSGAFMSIGPILCGRRWQRLLWFLGCGAVYAAGLDY